MSSIEVRPFRRSDRDQLTDLVNAHVEAVVPGMSVSVNAVLRQLERDPGEFIVDPWVSERVTLVAEQRRRIAAAAHLLRYFADERAGESYRGAGEIRWLLFWPEAPAGNPYWPDATQAAAELIAACVRQLDDWGVARQGADGALPADGVYGVPEQWPHIRAIYERAGFTHTGDTEIVYLARIGDLRRPRAHRGAGTPALCRDQRDSPVRGAGRPRHRLPRGGDAHGGRAAAPARRLGRHRQSPGHRAVSPPGRGDVAAGTGGGLAGSRTGRTPPGLRLA